MKLTTEQKIKKLAHRQRFSEYLRAQEEKMRRVIAVNDKVNEITKKFHSDFANMMAEIREIEVDISRELAAEFPDIHEVYGWENWNPPQGDLSNKETDNG